LLAPGFEQSNHLGDALGALLGRSVAGAVAHAERSFTGATALWLGDFEF